MAGPVDLTPLLAPGVHGFASAIPCGPWRLHALERGAVTSVSGRRLQEFTAGRYCAHQALRQLGIRDAAVPVGSDRAPQWPAGVVGSISHAGSCAIAIAARATAELLSLGIDVEEADPVEAELVSRIGAQQEYALLSALDGLAPRLAARLLFSMKEAAFKCLFQWSRTFLEFEDLRLLHAASDGGFAMASLRRDTGQPALIVDGRFAVTQQTICCSAALRRSNLRDEASAIASPAASRRP